jgi:hypothetical protein
MAILAKGGQTYTRLRFNHGPQADLRLRMEVDYSVPFTSSDVAGWAAEYTNNVRVQEPVLVPSIGQRPSVFDEQFPWDQPDFEMSAFR